MPTDTAPTLLGNVAFAALAIAAPGAGHAGEVHQLQADYVLGTSFEMAVAGTSESEARFAFTAAQMEIARLDKVLSAWRADSELSRLNGAKKMKVSLDLFSVLGQCEAWSAKTGGAFNARLGAVEAAWTAGTRPAPEAVCAAQTSPALDRAALTVERPAGVAFAIDALAKGYVIDAALTAARRAAPCARGMMLNIGGDLACFGTDVSGQAWRAGIADPANLADNAAPITAVALSNAALAVSGAGARDRMVDGHTASHILDPRTGQPAARSQVAVIAARAADADAAATAIAALPAMEGLALAERLDGVEALILADGGRTETSGWSKAEQTNICQTPLPAGYAVEINYEIPKINVGNYKKPFLIVWVTDADKNMVKSLIVMGTRKEWMESNNVWWRRYGRKDPDVLTKAQPTKAPGKYSIVWDGTDDSGKRVAQGAYTIHIEAAREHGGHAYQSVDVNLGAAGVQGATTGKDELANASVRYFKR